MIKFVQTCYACPEQYDAYLNGEKVGYLRLRHGSFRVDYPDCGGETIYQSNPKGDGIFTGDEREWELGAAAAAILRKIHGDNPTEDWVYTVVDNLEETPFNVIPARKIPTD